jgi:phosphodiesterase/alkaline phosphatase D-like protein
MKLSLPSFLLLMITSCLPAADLTRFVWSGAVTPHSVRVKAGLRADAANTRLAVSRFSDFSDPVYSDVRSVSLEVADGVGDYTVSGLQPLTQYFYRIEVNGQADERVGRFRTFPDGPSSFTFALSACAAQGSTDTVFLAIRDENPLFFLHTGDLHYLNIAQNDVNVFYDGYRQVLGSHTQRALYESTSLAYIWDDHDYGPNDSDSSSPSRTASRLAYRDYVPHYPLVAGAGDAPIQQTFSVGRVKFIMTDLRSEKDVPTMPAGPEKRAMSAAQEAWFFNELLDGRDNFAAVFWVSSYPWIGSPSNGSDFWNGYTHQRDRIAAFIKSNNIRNLSMLAGDAHMLAIDDGRNNTYPDGTPGFPVFQSAALTSSGSIKGGPYSHGTFPGDGQYGVVRVVDTGTDTVQIFWEGKHKDGRILVSHQFTVDASHLVGKFDVKGR